MFFSLSLTPQHSNAKSNTRIISKTLFLTHTRTHTHTHTHTHAHTHIRTHTQTHTHTHTYTHKHTLTQIMYRYKPKNTHNTCPYQNEYIHTRKMCVNTGEDSINKLLLIVHSSDLKCRYLLHSAYKQEKINKPMTTYHPHFSFSMNWKFALLSMGT